MALSDCLGLLGVGGVFVSYWAFKKNVWESRTSFHLSVALSLILILSSLLNRFNLPAFLLVSCWLLLHALGGIRSFQGKMAPRDPLLAILRWQRLAQNRPDS